MRVQDFAAVIRRRLEETNQSQHRAAKDHGLPQDAIRSVLAGHMPRLDRVAAICEALDLEFYIGPRRDPDDSAPTGIPPQQWIEALEAVTKSLRVDLLADISALLAEAATDSKLDMQPQPTETHQSQLTVPFAQHVRAAAGSGEMVFDETSEFRLTFDRSILQGWASPASLICIRASGDSMEPTLHDDDLVLIDRSSIDPADGQIFVIRTADGLAVKRLSQHSGRWMLTSDNPAYPLRPVEADDRLVGRVVWHGALAAVTPA